MRLLAIFLLLLCTLLAITVAVAPCDESLIVGTLEYEYGVNRRLSCKHDKEIVHNKNRYDFIKCWDSPSKNGWWHNNQKLTKLSTDTISIECKTKACHFISADDKVDRTTVKNTVITKCADPLQLDVGEGKLYDELRCNAKEGWFHKDDGKVKEATDEFSADCVSKDAEPCPFRDTSSDRDKKTHASFRGKTLSCQTGRPNHYHNLGAIEYKGGMFRSLTCDRIQWKDGEKQLAPATSNNKLEFTCASYCRTSDSTVLASVGDLQVNEFSCPPEDGLFNGPQRVKGDKLECSWDGGWVEAGTKLTTPATTELPLSCKTACGHYLKPDPSDATKWIIGLAEDVDEFEEVDGAIVFKCVHAHGPYRGKVKEMKDPKSAIKLNDTFLLPYLKCDAKRGYMDIAGKKLADAFDLVKIACENSDPSWHTTLAPTTITTTKSPVDDRGKSKINNPCNACPDITTMMLNCEECDNASAEIVFTSSKDNQKCEALSRSSGFQTENKETIDGKLVCDKTEKIWKTTEGDPVGKFAALKKSPDVATSNVGVVVGCSFAAVVIIAVAIVVILKVFVFKKREATDKNSTTKSRVAEEGSKKKKGGNDSILEAAPADTPPTLKL